MSRHGIDRRGRDAKSPTEVSARGWRDVLLRVQAAIGNDALSLIVRAALPAALFALGGVLIQYRPEGDSKTIAQ